MDNHETAINSLFGSDFSFENIFNLTPPLPFPCPSPSHLLQLNSDPQSPPPSQNEFNQYAEQLPLHSSIDPSLFASFPSSSIPPSPLSQKYDNHMTSISFDNSNANHNFSLEQVQSNVQAQPIEEAHYFNLVQSEFAEHDMGMIPEQGHHLPFSATPHFEGNKDTSTSSTDSVPSLDTVCMFNTTQEQIPAQIQPSPSEMVVDTNSIHIYDDSGALSAPMASTAHQSPHRERKNGCEKKPVNEFLYIEHTYCKLCNVSLVSDTKAISSVFCPHCGEAVPVDKQYLHSCIQDGHANAVCVPCANVSIIPGSPISTTSVVMTAPSVAKKRGRKARCGKCRVICASAAEKRHHMATVHSTDFQCEQCNAVLRSAENLRRHMMCHGPNPQHWCVICGAGFTQTRGWRVHQAECGKARKYLGVERKAIVKRSNGACTKDSDKRFECPECGDRFSVRPSVSRHIRIKHRGERPYKCELCTRSFTSKYNKKVHIMKSHRDHA